MPTYKCPRCQSMIEAASPAGLTCPTCGFPGPDRRAAAPASGWAQMPPIAAPPQPQPYAPPQSAPPQQPYGAPPYAPAGQPMAAKAPRRVSYIALLIVSIFVGALGIDRFMMGQVGLGILKLVTLGGCGIWWLIDVILIATKYKFEGVEYVDN